MSTAVFAGLLRRLGAHRVRTRRKVRQKGRDAESEKSEGVVGVRGGCASDNRLLRNGHEVWYNFSAKRRGKKITSAVSLGGSV